MKGKHKTSRRAGGCRDSKQRLSRFGVRPAMWCALGIGLVGLGQGLAQPFRIESSQLGPQSQPSFSVPSDTNAYYRLFGGAQTTNLQTVIALSLTNTLVAPQPPTNAGQFFYRAQRIAMAAPHDSDGDGIDDLWELANGLDPLDPSDAGQVAPGDTRTWLEVYNDERAVTIDYQYPPGQPTLAMALAQDPVSKAVYAAGYADGSVSGGDNHGLIMKSTDGGINWSTNTPLQDYVPGSFTGLTVDSSGSIYAVSETDSLTILKSSDGGTNWALVDRYFGETNWGTNNWAYTLGNLPARAAADKNGNIYVAGGAYVQVTGGFPLWFVRKFTAASNSWATVDVFKASFGAWPDAVACDSTGGVFVVGLASKSSLNFSWVVRHSGDGGATWRTVDTLQLSGNDTSASGATTDSKGNVYVVGNGFTSGGVAHGLVRASSDGGTSWRTINDTTNSGYSGITVDSAGRLDVLAGWTVRQSSDGGATWVDVDEFLYSDPSYYLIPKAILGLSDGGVLTAGWAAVTGNATQTARWLARRLPPPPPR